MGQRIINVLYWALHIPILIILIGGSLETYNDGPYNYSQYNIICEATGEPVVLQGSLDNKPWSISYYEIYEPLGLEMKIIQNQDMRFYCHYPIEIKNHIIAYQLAGGDINKQIQANKEYYRFREENEKNVPSVTNYELVLVNEDIKWGDYYLEYLWIILGAGLYYLLLQVVRMLYQYIVYGIVSLHPYKMKKTQSDRTTNGD